MTVTMRHGLDWGRPMRKPKKPRKVFQYECVDCKCTWDKVKDAKACAKRDAERRKVQESNRVINKIMRSHAVTRIIDNKKSDLGQKFLAELLVLIRKYTKTRIVL